MHVYSAFQIAYACFQIRCMLTIIVNISHSNLKKTKMGLEQRPHVILFHIEHQQYLYYLQTRTIHNKNIYGFNKL